MLAREHVGADGIIGLDALQDFRVLIDFRKQTIAIDDAETRKPGGGFEIIVRARQKLGQLLITDALVEGVRATVIIDTGAQASLANTALRDRIRAKRAQEVITTDSVPQAAGPKVHVVGIAPLMGEAIRRIHSGHSITTLFSV